VRFVSASATNTSGPFLPCLICPDEFADRPTVRSHILPRALFHSMHRGKQIVGPRADGFGQRVLQSGVWDDRLLCEVHEGALNEIDKYGIKFCREWAWQCALWRNGPVLEVRNPYPERLVSFACACVWRAAARGGLSPTIALGPYGNRLARRIFKADLSWSPPLLLSRLGMIDANGESLNMVIPPVRWDIRGHHFWRFSVCGLVFHLQLDARPTPLLPGMDPMNDRTTALVLLEPHRDVRTVPALMDSMLRMFAPPKRSR
jgi:hypothetical protein